MAAVKASGGAEEGKRTLEGFDDFDIWRGSISGERDGGREVNGGRERRRRTM